MRYTIEYDTKEGTKVIKTDGDHFCLQAHCEITEDRNEGNSGSRFMLQLKGGQITYGSDYFEVYGDWERRDIKEILKIILEHL